MASQEDGNGMQAEQEERDSSSDDDNGFGVQSPPLTKLISDTLRRYPEGGQILKELIQNADDAGATEVKFLLDHRQHSCNDVVFDDFERFQGPALYAWNNAVFRENDWQSIGKIGQSKKKDDPIKVGRFGLGFLSVFHLTDLPMIVSERYLGLIDPHRYCVPKLETSPAGLKEKLKKVFEHESHVSTFNGVFGLSRNTKSYNGTVFRFPLRQPGSNSQISNNVYTPAKIKDNLFETFKSEAPFALLFLKNVHSIALYEWKQPSKGPEFCFEIGVDKHTKELVRKEKEICKEAARTAASEEMPSDQIFVQLYSVTFIERNIQESIPHHWLTVNVVGTTDEVLTSLKTELSVLPWVGLAIRLPDQIECSACTHTSSAYELTTALETLSLKLAGSCVTIPWSEKDKRYTNARAFCFLPLPGRTELPVNIHGYFAVADNRQSIKWPGNDEKGNEALWNKKLLYKLVAPAYALLLACRCELVKYSNTPLPTENTKNVTDAFSAWPLISEVKKKEIWSEIVAPTVENTLQLSLLWTAADQGKWVKFYEARFLPSTNLSANTPCPPIVTQLLITCNVPVVSLPNDVRETFMSCEMLSEIVRSREVTPQITRDSIRQDPNCCSSLSKEELYSVLEYIVSDLKHSALYKELSGLPLLPIKGTNEADTFEERSGSNTKYLFCKSSNKVLDFLPGIEHLIVDPDLSVEVADFLCHVSEEGLFQLELATANVIASNLLENSILSWCNENYDTEIWTPIIETSRVEILLQKLWQWIEAEKPSNLEGLPVVPVSSPNTGKHLIHTLSDSFKFCALTNGDSIFRSILRQLDFVVIDNSIVPFAQFPQYFPEATPELVVEQLDTLDATACVESMTHDEKDFLRNLSTQLCEDDVDNHSECLRSLPIYQAGIRDELESPLIPLVDEEGQEAFLPPNPSIVSLPRDITYPLNMLKPSNSITVKLAKCLGIEELSFSEFCVHHLVPFALENIDQNRTKEGEDILKWILEVVQVQHQLQESSLIGFLSDQAFIKTRDGTRMTPTQLYDPDDKEFLELFDEEDGVFPDREYANFQLLLQKLGMKTWKVIKSIPHLLEPLLLDRAQSLCDPDVSETVVKSRGKFILEIVANFSNEIDIDQICELPFLLARDQPDLYPTHLDWYSNHSQKYSLNTLCLPYFERYSVHHLVGSVLPILSDEYSISRFQSDVPFRKITASDVIEQLSYISSSTNSCSIDTDNVDYTTEMSTMVLSIYNYLDSVPASFPEKCVWWQDADPPQFFSSEKFVVQFPSGLHLEPYFYATHKGQLKRFQELLGIKQSIDFEDALFVLDQIKRTCDSKERELNDDELIVCVSVLDWLCKEDFTPNRPILMPTAKRVLVAANQCIFDDRELFKRASSTIPGKAKDWIFVSEKITSEVAKYFEVPPLSQKVAPSTKLAISFSSAGQHESITRRIFHIVRDYETDIDIFKELIQNADDAGATEVKFLLDWRTHSSSSLLTDELRHWQGPALIAYNNATFSDQDFTHICKLAGESKKTDTMKTGRFGVGFCATYHLTDLPSFISRRYLTIFDPHTTYLGDRVSPNQPGMRVDLVKNHGDLKVYKDQFLPYDGVFDCNVFNLRDDGYPGTLFRFPYRTTYTRGASEISKQVYDQDQIESLVKSLKQEKENILLFLRSVQKVTLYELHKGAESLSEMSELYSIRCKSESSVRCTLMRGRIPHRHCETRCTTASVHASGGVSSDWIISSAHGCHNSMPRSSGVNQDCEKGLLPFAEIALKVEKHESEAISIPTTTDGKIFCFLPMPKYSGLSFHVNGFFDVSHDRRSLRATDDKTFGSLWNEHIARDTLHVAFIKLLQYLASQCTDQNDCFLKAYYKLWRFATTQEKVADYLHSQFSAVLPTVKENILWSAVRGGNWLSPKEVVVLKDKTMESNPDIVRDATHLLIQNNYNLVNIPEHVLMYLEESLHKCGRIFNYKKFCSELLFPRITKIPSDVRDRNIFFLLRKLGEHSMEDYDDLEWASSLITKIPCIPCQSSQTLKTPQELIDCRNPLLAKLYAIKEGRFPSGELQQCPKAMRGLCNLGMSSEKLNLQDLKERAYTVHKLAVENPVAAKERSHNLLVYISKVYALNYNLFTSGLQKTEKTEVLQCLSLVPFLPVLDKPNDIQIPWHGKENTYVSPSKAYSSKYRELLFSQCDIVSLPAELHVNVVSYLDVNQNQPTIDIVLEHFKCVIDSLPKELDEKTIRFIDGTVQAIYSFIDDYSTAHPKRRIQLPHRCIWWRNADPPQFLGSEKFVRQFPLYLNLEPYFYATQRSSLKRFQNLLGIKHTLQCTDGVSILAQINSTCDQQLDDHELKVCVSILGWLLKEEYASDGTILMPTTKRVLNPARECLFDDRELFKRASKTIPGKTKEWSFVSEKITSDIAKYFKVSPLSQKVAPSTKLKIAYSRAGQHESITRRIAHIVRDYGTDIDIFKELIQNADDAGATEVKFLLDWRTHSSSSLLTDELKHWQGPALIAYNNQTFSDQDFTHICEVAGESKKSDPLKTGRFGIGFNATYHLTDLPSFVSRRYLTIFDPHTKYLVGRVSLDEPGMRINLVETQDDLQIYKDQFLPYDGVFGCDIFNLTKDGYEGTLFRFPFRSFFTSKTSDISPKIFNKVCVDKLVDSLKEQKFELLLFLKHVKKITLYELPEGEKRLSKMSKKFSIECSCDHHERRTLMTTPPATGSYETCCTQLTTNGSGGQTSKWLISSAHGYTTTMPKESGASSKGLLPLAEVALKFERSESILKPLPIDGRLFCFLPLPNKSELTLHINGFFDVGKDRRNLSISDDRTFGTLWNEFISTDTLCVAFVKLLENLALQAPLQNEQRKKEFLIAYYELWRLGNTSNLVARCLYSQFKSKVPMIDEEILWSEVSGGCWLSPQKVYLFSDKILKSSNDIDITKDAISLLLEREYNIVEVPYHVFSQLKGPLQKAGRIFDYKRYCTEVFFPHIKEIDSDLRDRNIVFLLKKFGECTTTDHEYMWAKELLISTPCIPCQSSSILRKPTELVDCTIKILANLYNVEEGRFPCETLLECRQTLLGLRHLGMAWFKLNLEDLRDRACTVCTLNTDAASERSKNLLLYISQHYKPNRFTSTYIHVDKPSKELDEVRQCLSDVTFIPALEKPKDVDLPWHGKESSFVSPSEAFDPKHCDVVFTQCDVVFLPDEIYMHDLRCLGIWDNRPSIDVVLSHFECVITSLPVKLNEQTVKFLDSAMKELYGFINRYLKRTSSSDIKTSSSYILQIDESEEQKALNLENREKILEKLTSLKNVVWQDGHLLCVQQVCMHCPYSYYPYICQLSTVNKTYNKLFQDVLKVRNEASVEDMLHILEQIKDDHAPDTPVSKEVLDFIENLVKTLAEKFHGDATLNSLVFLPDDQCIMRPADQLACDKLNIEWIQNLPVFTESFSSGTCYFINGCITRERAIKLGVRPLLEAVLKEIEDEELLAGTDYGQHEDLCDRLNSILKKYQPDVSIFQEFIQNADDAQATEISFILDHRSFPDERLFSHEENWKQLQHTPALCIFNNQKFQESDIIGITKLGRGGKDQSAELIGKFGIGFNVAYHVTDCPSFLSCDESGHPENLCAFDPMRKFVPRASKRSPGKRWRVIKKQQDFPDQFLPYLGEDLPLLSEHHPDCLQDISEHGYVVFRLPLTREKETKHSSTHRNVPSVLHGAEFEPDDIVKLLKEFSKISRDMLLFLNNLKCISAFEIKKGKDGDQYIHHFTTTATIATPYLEKHVQFSSHLKQCMKDIEVDRLPTPYSGSHKVTVVHTETTEGGSHAKKEEWLVQRAISGSGVELNTLKAGLAQSLRPIGGVATLLSPDKHEYHLFCFLPMPIGSNLPVQINGHFVVDDSRKHLETIKQDGLEQWNVVLMQEIIIPAYIELVLEARSWMDRVPSGREWYYKLFPGGSELKGQLSGLFTQTCFYEKILKRDLPILLLENTSSQPQNGPPLWKSPRECYFCISFECKATKTVARVSTKLRKVFRSLGLPITDAPNHIYRHCSVFDENYRSVGRIDPSKVCEHMKKISLGDPRCDDIRDKIQIILEYCLLGYVENEYPSLFQNSLFLLAVDGSLKRRCLFSSHFAELLPHCSSDFVDKNLEDSSVGKELYAAGVIMPLSLKFVASHVELPSTSVPVFQNVQSKLKLVELFWKYISHTITYSHFSHHHFTLLFKEKAVLPTKDSKLFPVCLSKALLDVPESQTPSPLASVMRKLGYSELDFSTINLQGRVDTFRRHILHDITCTCTSGQNIVDCMKLQKPEKFNVNLTAQEVNSLTFCLSSISRHDILSISQYLLKMPLFKTVDMSFVTLSNYSKLLVIPSGMPLDGVHEIQKQTNFVVLVPPDETCQRFYTMVIPNYSSSCVSVQEFYETLLIPNFPHLSDSQIEEHMKYVFSDDRLFLGLQNCVKRTPFIRHDGKLCLVQDFYDPTVEYFHTFHANKLLPKLWHKRIIWRHRIIALGLNTEVTCDTMLSQAKQIEACTTMPTKYQSSILLKYIIILVEKCIDNHKTLTVMMADFLSNIADVSFIFRSERSRLATLLECIRLDQKSAVSNASALVKLSKSVSFREADLACLCRTVLPQECDKLMTNSAVRNAVRVEMPLQSTTVVENLVLLSKQVSGSCTRRHTSTIKMPVQAFADIFVKHYAYLNRLSLSCDEVTQLKEVMCILQEKGDLIRLVKPNQLVKNLPSGLKLEPFCYRVASWMQAYDSFLTALGVSDELKADDYASILTKIHDELENAKQNLAGSNFLNVARSAYEGLVQSLRQGGKLTSTDNSTLFLLDESKELVEACKLYNKDVPWHASRLPQDSNTYRYLLEPPLDSSGKRTIPTELAVPRLSEVLVEEICDECTTSDVVCPDEDLFFQGKRQEDRRCKVVQALLATLQSQELFDGFCRLYYHEHHSNPPTKSFISRLHTLRTLEVKCINTELKTELWDQGKVIPRTQSTLVCHMVNKQCLYISPHCDSFNEDTLWVQVSSAIEFFLDGEIQNQLFVKSMFQCSPCDISQILDESKVTPFTMTDLKPEERKTIGSVIPLTDLSPRDSIIVQNYRPNELVCYLSEDGVLTYALVVDTKQMVDDILQSTIKLRVAKTPVACKNTSDGSIEDNSDSDETDCVIGASEQISESSNDDEQSIECESTGEVEVLVSPLQVFKILSPSQEAWLWNNIQTPYADPIILAPIPYSDSAILKEWITKLYNSKNLKEMSGLMASMVTIRLIGHMHYQLVVQNHAPQLFTTAVMHIKQIVSEKDLPCTVINKRHGLHTSMSSLVDMVFKLSLDSDSDRSTDSDSDTPPMSSIPPQSHVYPVASGFGSGRGIYTSRPGGHSQQTTHFGRATAPLGGSAGYSPSVSGRTLQPASVPNISTQPRIPQPQTRRGYRAPQQNRRTRFPNVYIPPPTATAAEPPKPPPTCMQSASAWLEQAKADFKAAEVLLHGEGSQGLENKFPALVCFLCHDSVEKCLKGAHYAFCGLERNLVNSSNLVLLANGLAHCPQQIIAVFKECAMFMNQHENRSRFPNFQTPPCAPAVVYDVDSADEAITMVHRLFDELLKDDKLKSLLGDIKQLPKPRFASTLKSLESGSDSKMPSSWDVMAEDEEVKLSLLDLESPIEGEEYERVAGAFLQSLPNADIMRIDRVQNKLLWKKYCDRSETMMKFNNGILREQMLFHGTSHNDPALIYGEDVGFDRRFSGDGMWGQGNYFAVNAAYSNGYAYHSHGVRKMFAAWVLTGIPYDSPSNRSLRMPPYRDTFGRPENVIKRRYDCITGMTGGTRVYITYENDLAYPAYLITYRH